MFGELADEPPRLSPGAERTAPQNCAAILRKLDMVDDLLEFGSLEGTELGGEFCGEGLLAVDLVVGVTEGVVEGTELFAALLYFAFDERLALLLSA